MKHDYGFTATPKQMPPDRAPISKAPANRNEEYDPTAADFMAGMVEYEARTAIRDLVALYGNAAERLVAIYLADAKERKPRNG